MKIQLLKRKMPRYSLASADVDADGLTDLFVGAPFYHKVGWLPF